MSDIPMEIKRLPPHVRELMRHFGQTNNAPQDEAELIAATGLSERSLGKAIKRLVTRKNAVMDVHRRYQLTDRGLKLLDTLMDYDPGDGDAASKPASGPPAVEPIQRRLSVIVPEPFVANQETTVYLGLDEGIQAGEAELLVEVESINAEPAAQRVMLPVAVGNAHTKFKITPGEFTEIRLCLAIHQADPYSGDIHNVGGMYVDVDVVPGEEQAGQLAAFGTNVVIMP